VSRTPHGKMNELFRLSGITVATLGVRLSLYRRSCAAGSASPGPRQLAQGLGQLLRKRAYAHRPVLQGGRRSACAIGRLVDVGACCEGLDKHRAVAWGAPKGRPPARQPAANVTHAVFGCQDGYGIYTPLDKATSDGTILANPTNGSGLHVSHGYPFREVVPWYCGKMNAKWVTEVELIDHEYLGSWQRGGWSNDAK